MCLTAGRRTKYYTQSIKKAFIVFGGITSCITHPSFSSPVHAGASSTSSATSTTAFASHTQQSNRWTQYAVSTAAQRITGNEKYYWIIIIISDSSKKKRTTASWLFLKSYMVYSIFFLFYVHACPVDGSSSRWWHCVICDCLHGCHRERDVDKCATHFCCRVPADKHPQLAPNEFAAWIKQHCKHETDTHEHSSSSSLSALLLKYQTDGKATLLNGQGKIEIYQV